MGYLNPTIANAFGDGILCYALQSGGQKIWLFKHDGSMHNPGIVHAPDFNVTSDKRLKSNIIKIENSLEIIEKLNGYKYNLHNKDNEFLHKSIGLLAQDVQEILPELVKTSNDGYLQLNYNGIIALLVEAIKELRKEIKHKKKLLRLF